MGLHIAICAGCEGKNVLPSGLDNWPVGYSARGTGRSATPRAQSAETESAKRSAQRIPVASREMTADDIQTKCCPTFSLINWFSKRQVPRSVPAIDIAGPRAQLLVTLHHDLAPPRALRLILRKELTLLGSWMNYPRHGQRGMGNRSAPVIEKAPLQLAPLIAHRAMRKPYSSQSGLNGAQQQKSTSTFLMVRPATRASHISFEIYVHLSQPPNGIVASYHCGKLAELI
ncbi:hypothetical protein KCP73_15800 [Salmonella enterica subsp. enterica]|nr:hypothetical protein KCP73_15800 [Salmonella enterica subsp. enterica]